ncbi:MAG: 1,4-dihydroxy-2-naphthoate polyprenyltransferase [Propionibacteriaceae bacterium]|nr:1,4-dihydroxy-2-naphthoate polyprenyltransferase [Propionibacteriaceae bacterium]
MATPAQWVEGMRPRTLPLSISPVIAGSAVALAAGGFHPWRALLTLIVGVAMQVGVNLSNDYSDGVRGTDQYRVGPQRLVGSGAASPGTVKRAAFTAYGVGCLAGLGLVWLTHLWWLVALGVVIVLAAWFYTGGKHPYGYVGLGEVFVFLFFGVAATAGTVLVQTGFVPAAGSLTQHVWAVIAATACQGTGACAVLVANNLRDIPTDAMAAKKTLSVRLGDHRSRVLFVWLVVASVLALVATALLTHPFALLGLAMLAWGVPAIVTVARGGQGLELVRVLKLVGLAQLVGAIGLFLGVLVALLF